MLHSVKALDLVKRQHPLFFSAQTVLPWQRQLDWSSVGESILATPDKLFLHMLRHPGWAVPSISQGLRWSWLVRSSLYATRVLLLAPLEDWSGMKLQWDHIAASAPSSLIPPVCSPWCVWCLIGISERQSSLRRGVRGLTTDTEVPWGAWPSDSHLGRQLRNICCCSGWPGLDLILSLFYPYTTQRDEKYFCLFMLLNFYITWSCKIKHCNS